MKEDDFGMKEELESDKVVESMMETVDAHLVEEFLGMGFDEKQSKKALAMAEGNLDTALDYITNGIPPVVEAKMIQQWRMRSIQPQAENQFTPLSSATTSTSTPFMDIITKHPDFGSFVQSVREGGDSSVGEAVERLAEMCPEYAEEILENGEQIASLIGSTNPEFDSINSSSIINQS